MPLILVPAIVTLAVTLLHLYGELMSPLGKWFWIGFVPQMSIWIYMTVVGGMVVGAVAAAVAGPKRTA